MCLEENIVLFLEMCKRSQIDEKRNYMRSKTSQVLVILFIYFFYLSFQLGQSCCLISDVMEEFYCSWKMGILWQSQSLISEVLYPLPSPLNIFFFFFCWWWWWGRGLSWRGRWSFIINIECVRITKMSEIYSIDVFHLEILTETSHLKIGILLFDLKL